MAFIDRLHVPHLARSQGSVCSLNVLLQFRLVANLLFRMGGSAVLLSNNEASWGDRAKYRLMHLERVHLGQSDEAFGCGVCVDHVWTMCAQL